MNALKPWRFSRRWLIVPPVLVGLAVVIALAGSRQELPRSESGELAVPVDVVRVEAEPIRQKVIGYGTARPERIWTAVAEVGGRVVEVAPDLESGARVEQGDWLLKIDPTDYRLRIRQRTAELKQARAEFEQVQQGVRSDRNSLELQQALLEVRKEDVERLRQLQGSSAASQSEFDQAQAAYLNQALSVETLQRTLALSDAKLEAARAAIELAEARLQEAERDLERTTIAAPFDGLLVDAELQTGQYLSPGQTLFELHDNDVFEVEAQFSLAQLAQLVLVGQPVETSASTPPIKPNKFLDQLSATVTVRSGDVDVSFDGVPIRVTAAVDRQTRTLGVIVEVDSPARLGPGAAVALRSGAYCEVALFRKQPVDQIALPRTAIREGSVFVVDSDDRLSRRAVTIRGGVDDRRLVDGLRPGERVVLNPPADAAEGLLVRWRGSEDESEHELGGPRSASSGSASR
jgi:RND family efflux transporter MFP subunit